MWVTWIHDPKMLNLTLAEQGAWWRLLALAQECGADGDIVKGNGASMSLDEIAICIHLTRKRDRADFNSMIEKMIGLSSLHWNHDTLIVTHFADRQAQVPSDAREAVRGRVRDHRERKRVTENPLPPLTTPVNNTIEGEEEEDIEGNGRKSVTSDSVCAAISQLYSENIGYIKPALAEEIRDFCEKYRGPVSWIKPAFKEAINRNKKSWHYVRTILEDWEEKGGPDDESKGQRGARGKQVGNGAGRGHPPPGARESGWKDVGSDEPDPAQAGDQS